eukprot:48045-Eustigmatos_ZCMA.PRE.1
MDVASRQVTKDPTGIGIRDSPSIATCDGDRGQHAGTDVEGRRCRQVDDRIARECTIRADVIRVVTKAQHA